MATKGIFFDLYGTLYEYGNMAEESAVRLKQFHACLKEYGLKMPEEAFADYYRGRMAQLEATTLDPHLSPFEQRIQSACAGLSLPVPEDAVKHIAEELLEVWDRYVTVDPEARPVLQKLVERGKVVGLISNFDHPPYIQSLLKRSGLDKYLDPVVLSGDAGVRKPDPQIFHLALGRAGLTAEDAVYVGDSPEDITGANAAGMLSVLIDRHGVPKDYGQKRSIRSLTEMLSLA